jgi:cytochrome c biogenesis protein CcmG/thiol:disulfide interchange protein DsbE
MPDRARLSWRYLLPLLVLGLLLVLFGIGLRHDPRLVPSPLVGKPAPEFRLPRLDAPAKTLGTADLAGHVSLLNVWASWCVACRVEHPQLMQLARSGHALYGLNYKDERDAAMAWLAHHGNPFTASAVDQDGRVGIEFGVYGVPETFVLDAHGVIRYKHIGPVDEAALRDRILPLLAELEAEGKAGN